LDYTLTDRLLQLKVYTVDTTVNAAEVDVLGVGLTDIFAVAKVDTLALTPANLKRKALVNRPAVRLANV